MHPLAAAPDGPVAIPPVVERLAAGDAVTPVWRNELGGLTFRLGDDRYVKWFAGGHPEIDFAAEAERLVWAGPFVTVPEVLEVGRAGDDQWLVTAAIAGGSAVSPRWLADPQRAAEELGRGLRMLHDTLPVAACPFTWSVEERVARFEERVAAGPGPGDTRPGNTTPTDWMPEHRGLSIENVRETLNRMPPLDLVVCHGDACAPNTLIDDSGRFTGHVDLGILGVADRWADLAVAAWSTVWNYGPGYESAVYAAYGVEAGDADAAERIRYYRLLWDVS
ncbi:aminoglycoside 3'-phosphotransferase [Leifsonia bigeumensis]|uniref:Aminoglycoside 3'-phosphotransferase n=1 Tax=Leifsonella bigeumensis TaxID=433643 RepID=A0ABP7EYI2_9MICO